MRNIALGYTLRGIIISLSLKKRNENEWGKQQTIASILVQSEDYRTVRNVFLAKYQAAHARNCLPLFSRHRSEPRNPVRPYNEDRGRD